jgi:hypothetical protein
MKPISFRILLISAALIILFVSCGKKTGEGAYLTQPVFKVKFNPFSPKDLQKNASDTAFIKFAWEEFIALNWKSSFDSNKMRDYPDTTWNWGSDQSPYPGLLVWETYAHRTELRPYSNKMLPFDSPPHYSFGKSLLPVKKSDSFSLFDNLDENNEIGSCDIYAHVDRYNEKVMVLYQAKVNRDEYNYILDNYNTKQKLFSATENTYNNIIRYNAYYKGAQNTCNCPPDSNVLCLPCGGSPVPGKPGETYRGAMEIKSAWRILVPEDDTTKFLRRKAIVYQKGPDGKILYTNKTLGLIGLHIIHKTTNYQDFVIATFEQNGVENADMGYRLLDKFGNETGKLYSGYPRLHPIPAIVNQSTDEIHSQIKQMNPNSVWLNYRLVGVQAVPTSDSTSFSFFLANYVIESDSTLADFQGSGIGTPHNKLPNTLFNGQKYSMGGCQGCHGVAQIKSGTDFSFLLDTVGKPVYSPDLLDSIPKSKPGKLAKYIALTSRTKLALHKK